MRGVVQFRGVVEDEHQRLTAHGLPRLVPMRRHDGLHRRLRLIAQPVEPPQPVPVEDLRERLLRTGGDRGRRLDQPPRPPPVAQVRRAERLLGPLPRACQDIHARTVLP